MHQFVQSAIEAAKRGDHAKAMAFIKQVLNANPNDVDAWLVLAAIVDDPARKRQCLNRVLKLDPVNRVAREELMEMDRAEMGGAPAFFPDTVERPASYDEKTAPNSSAFYQPEAAPAYYSTGTSAFEPAEQREAPDWAKAAAQTPSPARKPAKKTSEKPLVFKYPLFWRIIMYVFVAVFGCVGLLMLTQDVLASLPFLGFAALKLVAALALSPTVEVNRKGIRASGMFSSAETGWDEITRMKSNAMKRRLELTKRNGEVVNVSTQVSGYPKIVEILQKRRPDLFGMAPIPQTQTSAFSSSHDDGAYAGYGVASPAPVAPAFKGTRTFKKSFFKQYGSYLIVLPLLFFAAYTALTQPQNRIGAGIAVVFCLGMLVLPFFQVSAVKVEPGKLTVESLFEEKVFKANEIREIRMDTVRGKYGRATNFVNILPVRGKNYPLEGFSEGNEIIYGTLMNWWNAHGNG